MNSLIDESVIRALYLASSSGVKIDLIVRGACALRPGVPGLSENIRVRSIIGRFLEHERIYYFRNDLKHDLYLSSADWMARNLFRRIEVAYPVLDPALKKRVIAEGLKYYLRDNTNSWELQSNGTYRRRKLRKKQVPFGAQQHLAEIYDANVQKELVGPEPPMLEAEQLPGNPAEVAHNDETTDIIATEDSPLTETMPDTSFSADKTLDTADDSREEVPA